MIQCQQIWSVFQRSYNDSTQCTMTIHFLADTSKAHVVRPSMKIAEDDLRGRPSNMMCHECVPLSPYYVTNVQLKVAKHLVDLAPKDHYGYILRILNCNEIFNIEKKVV